MSSRAFVDDARLRAMTAPRRSRARSVPDGIRASRVVARADDASADDRRAFIFGVGYLGAAVARRFASEGYVVRGTFRGDDAATTSTLDVVSRAYEWDGERACEEIEREVRAATHVVSFVPPVRASGGDGWRDPVYDAFASALASGRGADGTGTRFFGYASSTSVYGDHGGELVDETTACRPTSVVSRARFEGEERWRALARESNGRLATTTFRLGGIYGPGRCALETVMRRESGARESASQRARSTRRFTSRVHVDDAARLVIAAANAGRRASDVYNVVDDRPISRRDALAFAEQILHVSSVEDEDRKRGDDDDDSDDDAGGESARGEKRASNRRMKETLATFGDGASMLYPSVYHGLLRIAASRGILVARASEDEFDTWFNDRFDALGDGEYAHVALEELRES